jgi:hypothetical protein
MGIIGEIRDNSLNLFDKDEFLCIVFLHSIMVMCEE